MKAKMTGRKASRANHQWHDVLIIDGRQRDAVRHEQVTVRIQRCSDHGNRHQAVVQYSDGSSLAVPLKTK